MISTPRSKRPQLIQAPYPPISSSSSGRTSWETSQKRRLIHTSAAHGESAESVVSSEPPTATCGFSSSACPEKREEGALRVWLNRLAGTPRTSARETLDSNHAASTPITPTLFLSTSRSPSSSAGHPTPPRSSSADDGLFLAPVSPPPSHKPRLDVSSAPSSFSDDIDEGTHPKSCLNPFGLFLSPPPPPLNRLRSGSSPAASPRDDSSSFQQDVKNAEEEEEEAGETEWERLPEASSIPLNRGGRTGQRYAPPIEEENVFKRIVWTKPEVRARPGYRGLREVPPVPIEGSEGWKN